MEQSSHTETFAQVQLGHGPNGYENVSTAKADEACYKHEHESIKATLTRLCKPRLWPKGSYSTYCPRPILVHEKHKERLQELNDALVASITDIVDRWWVDTAADFPGRMPLGEMEQELLKVGFLVYCLGGFFLDEADV
jgi:hypothetical protein